MLTLKQLGLLTDIYTAAGHWNDANTEFQDTLRELCHLGLTYPLSGENGTIRYVITPKGAYEMAHNYANSIERDVKTIMKDYTEVMINAVTISEVFADVCGEARYFTMELLNHRQENGNPMAKEEITELFSKMFDVLWEKRMNVGKGN